MQLPAVCKKINIWMPKYVTTILLGNCGKGVLLPPWFVLRKPPRAGRVPRGTGMLDVHGFPGTRRAPEAAEEKQSYPVKRFLHI